MLTLRIVLQKSWTKKRFISFTLSVEVCNFVMPCSYNFGLIALVMFGNFAKLDSPRRLVQLWQNFQTSFALLIPNCTHHRMITCTNLEIIIKDRDKFSDKEL